jgi:hypothetical protein
MSHQVWNDPEISDSIASASESARSRSGSFVLSTTRSAQAVVMKARPSTPTFMVCRSVRAIIAATPLD